MVSKQENPKLRFFKDSEGRVVLWQWPNLPLYGLLLTSILSRVMSGSQYVPGIRSLGDAFLFTWAFLELTQGVNYFRRSLGLIVLLLLIVSFFK